jgi:hypothetical protein
MNTGDYNGIAVGVDQSNITNWNVGNNSTGNIYLSFDYAGPGYPNTVNAITNDNIEKINAISSANIDEVNSVS